MPDGTESCPRRATSNTPLQALTLLNSPWFTESAHALAKRILKENPGADSQVRLDWAFRTCVGRAPTSEELTVLLDHLAVQTSSYANEPERATVAFGEAAGDLPVPEFAAWSSVARVVLNLDEFITRE